MITFEKIYLVLQVVRAVVLRCSRKKTNVWINTRIRANFLYQFVKGLIHHCSTIAELMAFVNDNEAIVFILQSISKFPGVTTVIIIPAFIFCNVSYTSRSDKVYIRSNLLVRILIERGYSLFPSRLDGRRCNNQYFALSTIILWHRKESFYNQCTNYSLSQSNHIGQHKASMFVHDTNATFYSLYLVI